MSSRAKTTKNSIVQTETTIYRTVTENKSKIDLNARLNAKRLLEPLNYDSKINYSQASTNGLNL